jgi:hypothetical protein
MAPDGLELSANDPNGAGADAVIEETAGMSPIGSTERTSAGARLQLKKSEASFRGAPASAFTRVCDALWARARNPEAQEVPMYLGSGPAASRRPGMTVGEFFSSLLEKVSHRPANERAPADVLSRGPPFATSPRRQFKRRHIHSHLHINGFRVRLSTGVLRLFAH